MFSQSLVYSFFINIQKMESITFIETILKDVQVYDILENKLYKICPIPSANSLSPSLKMMNHIQSEKKSNRYALKYLNECTAH